jgi:hypothetical protein
MASITVDPFYNVITIDLTVANTAKIYTPLGSKWVNHLRVLQADSAATLSIGSSSNAQIPLNKSDFYWGLFNMGLSYVNNSFGSADQYAIGETNPNNQNQANQVFITNVVGTGKLVLYFQG